MLASLEDRTNTFLGHISLKIDGEGNLNVPQLACCTMSFRSPVSFCGWLVQLLIPLLVTIGPHGARTVVLGQRFDCSTEANCVYRPLFRIRAVVHGHDSDPFWQRVASAMEQTGRDMNVDLTIQFHPSAVYDGQTMADQVTAAAATTPPPDAMIVTIPDNLVQKAVGAVIEGTTVPVFGLNTGADVQTINTKGFVAIDDRLAGATAGDEFRKLFDSPATSTERSAAPMALFVNHACKYLVMVTCLCCVLYTGMSSNIGLTPP
jgi:ABC-type sugar transport system substrate-binding protein